MTMRDLLVILAWLVIDLATDLPFGLTVTLILVVLSLLIVRALAGERVTLKRGP